MNIKVQFLVDSDALVEKKMNYNQIITCVTAHQIELDGITYSWTGDSYDLVNDVLYVFLEKN